MRPRHSEEMKRLIEPECPQIMPPKWPDHLRLVQCIVTEEERFKVRIKLWAKRESRTRLDFY